MYHCYRECLGITTGQCDLCMDGYYGFNNAQTCALCDAGSYCNGGVMQGLCAAGHYCEAGATSDTEARCPPGTFGEAEGLEGPACSGACDAGYWCGEGSITAQEGSCRAGNWGGTGQTNEYCSGSCSAGYFCPEGSSSSQAEPCGSAAVFCPDGSAEPTNVSSGFYSTPEANSEALRSSQAVCPKGHFCSDGVKQACPAGTFSPGLGAVSCQDNLCQAGYFCPEGSTSPTAGPCFDDPLNPPDFPALFYCPEGTTAPIEVLAGYFSTPEDAPESQRDGQELAESTMYLVRNGQRLRKVEWRGVCTGDAGEVSLLEWTNAGLGEAMPGGDIALLEAHDNIDDEALDAAAFSIPDAAANAGDGSVLSANLNSAACVSYASAYGFPFEVQASGTDMLALKDGRSLDHETCDKFVLDVEAVSKNGENVATCRLTVNVDNNNDMPYFEYKSNAAYPYALPSVVDFYVDERSEPNTGVGSPLRANDEDVGQEIFFSIAADALDGALDMFYIGSCSGQIYVQKAGLDFVAKPQYHLQVQVCDDPKFFGSDDAVQCSVTADITVHVRDINDSPEFRYSPYSITSFRVPENSPAGTLLEPYCTDEGAAAATEAACAAVDAQGLVVDDLDLAADMSSAADVMVFTVTRNAGDDAFAVVSCDRANNLDSCTRESGSELELVADELVWDAALSACDARTGDLVSLGSEEDQLELAQLLAAASPAVSRVWLGAEYVGEGADEGWQWTDGSPLSYENWGQTTAGGAPPEDFECAAYDVSAGVWEPEDCLATLPHVCHLWALAPAPAGALALSGLAELNFELDQTFSITVRVNDGRGGFNTTDVSIFVTDVNDAPAWPSDAELVPIELAENDASALGELFATDEDADAELTYQVVAASDAAGNDATALFSMHPGNSATAGESELVELRVTEALDFEASAFYSVDVRVTDDGGLSADKTFVATVKDVNEPPALTTTALVVAENVAIGAIIAPALEASDVDAGQIAFFALDDGYDADMFAVSTLSGNVSVRGSLNFEDKDSYTISVSVSDNGVPSLTTSALVTIAVTDEREPPTFASEQRFRFFEAPALNSSWTAPIDVQDEDAGDTATLVILSQVVAASGKAVGFFEVDGLSLVQNASSASLPNFESSEFTSYNDKTIQVRLQGTDSTGLTSESTVVVEVLDTNDRPLLQSQNLSVSKHAEGLTDCTIDTFCLPGLVLLNVYELCSDEDIDDDERVSAITYSITSGNEDGTFVLEDGVLSVETITANLKTSGHNFELVVTATDHDADAPLTSTPATYFVAVSDVNYRPSIQDHNLTLTENADTFYIIVDDVGALDPENSTLVFEIAEVFPSRASALFFVEPTNGSLYLTQPVDYETLTDGGDMFVKVRVRDNAGETGNSQSAIGTVSISVVDVNEPPAFPQESYSYTVDELSAAGDVVEGDAATAAEDPDAADAGRLVYRLVSQAGAAFAIDAASGQISHDGSLDFEAPGADCTLASGVHQCALTVEAEDVAGETAQAAVYVNVVNVNEAPFFNGTACVGSAQVACVGASTVELDENIFGGSTLKVAQFSSDDPDKLAGLKLSFAVALFSFTDGELLESGQTLVDGVFQVDASGNLFVVGSLDFENRSEYAYRLTVSDQGDGSQAALDASFDVTIRVRDVNDIGAVEAAAPTAASPWSTAGGDAFELSGANLGPTAFKADSEGAGFADVSVFLVQKSTLQHFEAGDCAVTSDTTVACGSSPEGVGKDLYWQVVLNASHGTYWVDGEVDGAVAASAQASALDFGDAALANRFQIPVVSGVRNATALPTAGGARFAVAGSNFGAGLAAEVVVTYRSRSISSVVYTATDCEPSVDAATAEELMTCTSVEGSGPGLEFLISVQGQTSAAYFYDATYSHAAPALTAPAVHLLDGTALMRTSGGSSVDALVVSGTDFGGAGTLLSVTYGPHGQESKFAALQCAVTEAHVQITCQYAAGTGTDLRFVVTVDFVSSSPSGAGLSYAGPTIEGISGPGSENARTSGGDAVYVSGSGFGPVSSGSTVVAHYGGEDGSLYTATECAVQVSDSLITCLTSSGTGRGHAWVVTVSGQASEVSKGGESGLGTSYSAPTVNYFEGTKEDAVTDGGEEVTLVGLDFGDDSALISATFGPEGVEYDARSCRIDGEYLHSKMTCELPPGIGSRLKWTVYVDGQASKVPTTEYKAPVVSFLAGAAVDAGASTEGGEEVVISGLDFGPAELHAATVFHTFTYGAVSGREYEASNCTVAPAEPTTIASSIPPRSEVQALLLSGTREPEVHVLRPFVQRVVLAQEPDHVAEVQVLTIADSMRTQTLTVTADAAPVGEVQVVRLPLPQPAGATFALELDSSLISDTDVFLDTAEVSELAGLDASSSLDLEAALRTLPQLQLRQADVTVSAVDAGSEMVWTVSFPAEYGDVPELTVSDASSDLSGEVTVETQTQGVGAGFLLTYEGAQTPCMQVGESRDAVEVALEALAGIHGVAAVKSGDTYTLTVESDAGGSPPNEGFQASACGQATVSTQDYFLSGDLDIYFDTTTDCELCTGEASSASTGVSFDNFDFSEVDADVMKDALERFASVDSVEVTRGLVPGGFAFTITFSGAGMRGNVPEITVGHTALLGDAPTAAVSTLTQGQAPGILLSYDGTDARCLAFDAPNEALQSALQAAGADVAVEGDDGNIVSASDTYDPTLLALAVDSGCGEDFACGGAACSVASLDVVDPTGRFRIRADTTQCSLCEDQSVQVTSEVDSAEAGSFAAALAGLSNVNVTVAEEAMGWSITFLNAGNMPDDVLTLEAPDGSALGVGAAAATEVLQQGNELSRESTVTLSYNGSLATAPVHDGEATSAALGPDMSEADVAALLEAVDGLLAPVTVSRRDVDDGVGGVEFLVTFGGSSGNIPQLGCGDWSTTSLSSEDSSGAGMACSVSTVRHGSVIVGGEVVVDVAGEQVTIAHDASAEQVEQMLRNATGEPGINVTRTPQDALGGTGTGGYTWTVWTPSMPREDIALSASTLAADDAGVAPAVQVLQPEPGASAASCLTSPGVGAGLRFVAKIADQESELSTVELSYQPPRIDAFMPATGVSSDNFELTLSGANFGSASDGVLGLEVTLRNVPLEVLSHAHREVVVRVPEYLQRDAGNAVQLSVGGQAATASYSFGPPSVTSITAVSPPQNLTGPPQEVLIRGENFGLRESGDAVLVDGEECLVTEWSHTTILCNLTRLDGDMSVTVGAQTCSDEETGALGCCPCGFGYAALLASPEVTSVSACGFADNDDACPTAGGFEVKIFGQDLGTPINGRVLIGGSRCEVLDGVNDYTDTEITCVVPEGEGEGDVIVQHAWKTSQPGIGFFYDVAVLNSVTPDSGTTRGGVNVTLAGRNFGISGPEVVFALSDGTNASCALQTFDHETAVCALPEGQGLAPIRVAVAGVAAANELVFDYLLPSVESISPAAGSTDGGFEMTLFGSNFGLAGEVLFDEATACAVTSYSHGAISCTVPAGAGKDVQVAVRSGERMSNHSLFAYDAPSVTAVLPAHGPTSGGMEVTIQGANFFSSAADVPDVQVTVGNYSCEAPQVMSSSMLTCTSPVGIGLFLAVNVTVQGQTSQEPLAFDFDAPYVRSVSPYPSDALGGQVLSLFGGNFGSEQVDPGAPGLMVRIADAACANAVRTQDDVALTCELPALPVGRHDVEVLVARQGAVMASNNGTEASGFFAACTAGHFGQETEFCEACPAGATCRGFDNGEHHEPLSVAGYGSLSRTVFQPCEPTYACLGNDTCLDGYEHKNGALRLCGVCVEDYYRLDGDCIPCPDLAWLILVGCFFVAAALCSMAYFLTKYGVQLAAVSICIDFCQVVSLFASYDFAWPPTVNNAYSVLSAFNLNLELASPECSVGWDYQTKWNIMYFMPLVFAMLFATSFVITFVKLNIKKILKAARRLKERKSRKKGAVAPAKTAAQLEREKAEEEAADRQLEQEKVLLVDDDDMESYDASFNRFIDAEFGAFLLMCYYLYLSVMKKCFETFRCTDGEVPLLRAEPSEPCNDTGDFYPKIHGLAVWGLFMYGIGIPSVIAYLLISNRAIIKQDQGRREMALKLSETAAAKRLQSAFRGFYVRRVVDPRAILRRHKTLTNIGRTRAKYGKLYEDFTGDCYYWRLVLMIRKVVLVMITMFLDDKFKQSTMAFAVLFASYVVHEKKQPYLSRYPDDRQRRKQIKEYHEWQRRAEMRNEVKRYGGRVRALQVALKGKMDRLGLREAKDDRVLKSKMDFKQLEVNTKAGDIVRVAQQVTADGMTAEEHEKHGLKSPVEKRWQSVQHFVTKVDNKDKFVLNAEAAQHLKSDTLRWLFDYNTLETISLATLMYILLFGLLFDTYAAQADSFRINALASFTIAIFVIVIMLFMSSVVIDIKRKFYPVFKEKIAKEGLRAFLAACFRRKRGGAGDARKRGAVAPSGASATGSASANANATKKMLAVRGQWVSPVNPFATLLQQNAELVRAEEARLSAIMASKTRHQQELRERELQREEEKAKLDEAYRGKMELVERELRELEETEKAMENELDKEMLAQTQSIDAEMQQQLSMAAVTDDQGDAAAPPGDDEEANILEERQQRKEREEETFRAEQEIVLATVEAEKVEQLAELKAKHAAEVMTAMEDLERQADEVFDGHRAQQEEIKARLQERRLRKNAHTVRRRRAEPAADDDVEKSMQALEDRILAVHEKQEAEELVLAEKLAEVKDAQLAELRKEVEAKVDVEISSDKEFEAELRLELEAHERETQELMNAVAAPVAADGADGADEAQVQSMKDEYEATLAKLQAQRAGEYGGLRAKVAAKRQERLEKARKEEEAREEGRLQALAAAEAKKLQEEQRIQALELEAAEASAAAKQTEDRSEVEALKASFENHSAELARAQEEKREARKVALEKRLESRKKALEAKQRREEEEKQREDERKRKEKTEALSDEKVAEQLEKIKADAIQKKKELEGKLKAAKAGQRDKLRERLAKKRKAAEAKKTQVLEEKKREEEVMEKKLNEEESALREQQAREIHEIEEAKIDVFLDEGQAKSLVQGVAAWRKRKEEQEKTLGAQAPKRSDILKADFAAKASRIEELSKEAKADDKEMGRLVKELENLYVNLNEEVDAEINKVTNQAAVEKARQKRKLQNLKSLVNEDDNDDDDDDDDQDGDGGDQGADASAPKKKTKKKKKKKKKPEAEKIVNVNLDKLDIGNLDL